MDGRFKVEMGKEIIELSGIKEIGKRH